MRIGATTTTIAVLAAMMAWSAGCAVDDGGRRRDARAREEAAPEDDAEAPDEEPGEDVGDDTKTPPPDESPGDDVMDVVVPPRDTGMDAGIDRAPPPDVMDVPRPMDVAPDRPPPPDAPVDVPPLPPVVNVVVGTAPADAPARFGGPEDATRAPAIVYPTPGAIVPPNLRGLEVHYRPGTGNDLFEVSFVGAMNTINVYAGCTSVGGGCALALDDATYNMIARAARPSGEVRVTVRGTAASAGGRFGRSPSQTLGVTDNDLRGGLYYWTAASGNIVRYEFGLPGARAEVYMRGGDPFNCVGCHALSRDGRRIAVGRGIPSPSRMQTHDTPTRGNVGAGYGSNFAAFSPDNSRLITSDGARLALLDGATGAVAPGLAGGTVGSMPDWSPDGRLVVFSRPSSVPPFGGSPGHAAPASLRVMPWSGTAFGAATDLVTAGPDENNYYPGFSPDSAWVLFNRAPGESSHNIAARLWVVRATGGAPVRLAAADGTGDLGNSWPKWAPFVESYRGEPLMWLTFSSRRDYGLRLQQQTRPPEERRVQLWMAAFRPNRAAAGDPSSPAFWLPMQSLSDGNHIAQWAQEVRRQGCTRDADCGPNEVCTSLTTGAMCVGN